MVINRFESLPTLSLFLSCSIRYYSLIRSENIGENIATTTAPPRHHHDYTHINTTEETAAAAAAI